MPAERDGFLAVTQGETLVVVKELADGILLVRRNATKEEGHVRRDVFDDLHSIEDSGLFSN